MQNILEILYVPEDAQQLSFEFQQTYFAAYFLGLILFEIGFARGVLNMDVTKAHRLTKLVCKSFLVVLGLIPYYQFWMTKHWVWDLPAEERVSLRFPACELIIMTACAIEGESIFTDPGMRQGGHGLALVFHHLLCLLIGVVVMFTPYLQVEAPFLCAMVEWSGIFNAAKELTSSKFMKLLFSMLFAISFWITRLVLWIYITIYYLFDLRDTWRGGEKHELIMFAVIFTLFAMQLNWSWLILKKVIRTIKGQEKKKK